MNPYTQTVSIPISEFESKTPAISEAAAALGRDWLEHQKGIARDAGLSELPACVIHSSIGDFYFPAVPLK